MRSDTVYSICIGDSGLRNVSCGNCLASVFRYILTWVFMWHCLSLQRDPNAHWDAPIKQTLLQQLQSTDRGGHLTEYLRPLMGCLSPTQECLGFRPSSASKSSFLLTCSLGGSGRELKCLDLLPPSGGTPVQSPPPGFGLVPVLAASGIWGVHQQVEVLCLCLSAF